MGTVPLKEGARQKPGFISTGTKDPAGENNEGPAQPSSKAGVAPSAVPHLATGQGGQMGGPFGGYNPAMYNNLMYGNLSLSSYLNTVKGNNTTMY